MIFTLNVDADSNPGPINLINNKSPDNVCNWWIKSLNLHTEDEMSLEEGQDLTDNVINAAQVLAHRKFPQFSGFQNTVLGIKLMFKQASKDRPTVQILHTGMSHSNT